jgi:hypothetical protein
VTTLSTEVLKQVPHDQHSSQQLFLALQIYLLNGYQFKALKSAMNQQISKEFSVTKAPLAKLGDCFEYIYIFHLI